MEEFTSPTLAVEYANRKREEGYTCCIEQWLGLWYVRSFSSLAVSHHGNADILNKQVIPLNQSTATDCPTLGQSN